MDPNKSELEKTEPELATIAKEILQYRIATSTKDTYTEWKNEELEKLSAFIQSPMITLNGLNGILGEAIFLDLVKNSNIPIQVATGGEDLEGIDFYFNGFPIDVTTNPCSLERKIDSKRYATIYLPRYCGQRSVLNRENGYSNKDDYVLKHLSTGSISTENYLYDLLTINVEVLKTLGSQIEDPTATVALPNAGLNNEGNLNIILQIFINSNLYPNNKN